jgi:hypothetical protein
MTLNLPMQNAEELWAVDTIHSRILLGIWAAFSGQNPIQRVGDGNFRTCKAWLAGFVGVT